MAETGFELNISGLEESLNRIDKSIKSLATTTRNSTNKMIQSFNAIQKNGLSVFSQEIAKLNTTLSNFGKNANISKSADDIVKLANALQQLTDKQKLQLKTENKKVDYAKQKNDLKEIAILEKERARELSRIDKANANVSKKRDALEIKKLQNETRALMNAERQRERALLEADMKDRASHKNRTLRLRREMQELDRLAKAYKAMPKTISAENVDGLIGQSKNATSINQRITAIHNLKNALKDLDLTTEEGRKKQRQLTNEIVRQQKELKRLGTQVDSVKHKKQGLLNYADQLRRGLALVFSVSQIKNYIVQLVKIRAEFEMQQRSLEVLLQNKDEANKLWSQTVQLAVKSPFTVKELVTYTKQLAAYRIESDKLFETNKMLADVSAGLGVDMQRLILAFGQVKAANYLRGTELRQFSEAGVNMLGELAKYYTELEGKVVSVGEVFNMISKRQVDFEDVAEIFKRITSEGGLFFQMQEKQSETTLGQWRNLIDSLHLMFNEIGKANDGVIKDSIESLRNMINNWQEIVHLLKVLVLVLSPVIFYFTASKIASTSFGKAVWGVVRELLTLRSSIKKVGGDLTWLSIKTNLATKSLNILKTSVKGLAGGLAGLAIGWLVMEFVEWISSIREASREFERLEDAITQVGIETQKDLSESIGQYKRLANTLTDATKSYKERTDAMQTMNRIFEDILPQEMLEVENIKAMSKGYEEATNALRFYYATKAEQRKKEVIDEKIEPKLQEEITDFATGWLNAELIGENLGKTLSEAYDIDKEGALNIFGQVIDDAKKGLVEYENILKEFYDRINTYYDISIPFSGLKGLGITNAADYKEILRLLDQRKDLFALSSGMQFGTKEEKIQYEQSKKTTDLYKEQKNALDDLTAAYSTYFKLRKKGGTDAEFTDAELDITNIYSNLGLSSPENIKEITADAWAIRDELGRVGEVIGRNFSASIADGIKNNPFLKNFQETVIDKDLEVFRGNKWTKSIDALVKNAAKEYKVELSELNDLIVKTNMGVDDFGKAVKSKYESVTEVVEKFNLATEGHGPIIMQRRQELIDKAETRLQITEEEIKQYEKMIPMLEFIAKMIGISLSGKTTRGGSGQGKDWYLELAKGLQSVHKDFLTLNKDLDKTRAEELALAKNIDVLDTAFTNAGIGMDKFMSSFDLTTEEGMISALEAVLDKLPTKAQESKIAIEKILSDIKGELEVSVAIKDREAVERMFDDMFSNYEMTMELESEGLNADWFGKMFGFTPTSLDDIRKNIQENLGKEFRGKPLLSDEELIGEIEDSDMDKGLKDKFVNLIEDIKNKEVKTLQDQMKTYLTNLKNGLSDRLKIWDEYYKEEKKIKDAAAVAMKDAETEEQKANVNAMKDAMLQGASKTRDDKLQKADWDELKGSETYMMLMNNIEVASEGLLNSTLEKLKDFKEQWKNMPYSEMKKVAEDISKIELALTNLKRAGQIRREIKDTTFEYQFEEGSKEKDINQKGLKGINVSAVAEDVAKKAEQIGELEKQLDLYNQINSLIEQDNHAEAEKLATASKLSFVIDSQGKMVKINTNELENQKTALEDQVANGQEIVSAENARNKAQAKAANNIQKALDYSNKLYNSAKGLAEALGAGDGVGAIFADMAMQMMNSVLNTIMLQVQLASTTVAAEGLGAAMKSAMGPIGWIVMALELVVMGLTAIFKVHDKKLEKQIDNLKDKVDLLEKSYENLEKAIERATSTAAMKSNYDQAIRNLQAQADAYEKMAKLEEDKKKTDEEQLKEYQEKQQEALEKQRELLEEQVESFGATYVYRDVAEDFVNAWADAFAETGNGLSGLDSAWDDYFNNIMKNTIASAGVSKIMQKVIDKVNSSLEDDFEIDENEYRQIESLSNGAKAEIDAYLQKMAELYPEVFDGSGGDTMSGLQRGIHELSESTGEVIAAYLDSLRFFVSDNNTKLGQFLQNYNVTANNYLSPILTQVTSIADDTSAIRSLLDSIISTYTGNAGGKAVKIIM